MAIPIHPNNIEEVNKYFQEDKFKVNLSPNAGEKTFRSLDELGKYIDAQCTFWEPFDNEVMNSYQNLKSQISQLQHSSYGSTAISNILNKAGDLFQINQNGNGCIYSQTREAIFLRELSDNLKKKGIKEYDQAYKCAKRFLLNPKADSPMNKNSGDFIALLDTYMAFYASDALKDIVTTTSESLSNLHEKFLAIADAGEKRNIESDAFSKKSQNDFKTMQNTVSENAKNAFDKQQEEFQNIFTEKENNWHSQITVLEKLYEEKLQLAAPVKYWEEMVKQKTWHGWLFVTLSIVIGSGLAIILFLILHDIHLIEVFNTKELNMNGIRGTLLLFAITSILGYLLHILVKFTLDSFH